MSVGALGFLGVGVNSSGGTASFSSTITDYIPILSENLIINREDLDDLSIEAQWDQVKVYNGLQRISGSIETLVHPLVSGYLFRTAFDATSARAGFISASHAGVRAHTFTTKQTQFQAGSGCDLPTMTYEVYRGPAIGVGSSFAYYGIAGNTLEVSIEAGQLARMRVDVLGVDYSRVGRSTPAFPTATAFLWSQASVSIAGGGTSLFESLTVRLNNQMEAFPAIDGRLRPALVKRNGLRTVEVSGRLSFQSDSEYDRFYAGSETQMLCTFTGDTAISAAPINYNMLRLDIPKMRYTAFPLNIAGPGRISIDFTGRGVYDQTSGYALECTLVNTRMSAYTVNSNG